MLFFLWSDHSPADCPALTLEFGLGWNVSKSAARGTRAREGNLVFDVCECHLDPSYDGQAAATSNRNFISLTVQYSLTIAIDRLSHNR